MFLINERLKNKKKLEHYSEKLEYWHLKNNGWKYWQRQTRIAQVFDKINYKRSVSKKSGQPLLGGNAMKKTRQSTQNDSLREFFRTKLFKRGVNGEIITLCFDDQLPIKWDMICIFSFIFIIFYLFIAFDHIYVWGIPNQAYEPRICFQEGNMPLSVTKCKVLSFYFSINVNPYLSMSQRDCVSIIFSV